MNADSPEPQPEWQSHPVVGKSGLEQTCYPRYFRMDWIQYPCKVIHCISCAYTENGFLHFLSIHWNQIRFLRFTSVFPDRIALPLYRLIVQTACIHIPPKSECIFISNSYINRIGWQGMCYRFHSRMNPNASHPNPAKEAAI